MMVKWLYSCFIFFPVSLLLFSDHLFESCDFVFCSHQSIARTGTLSFFEMFIIWFCGDICGWKFRWVWHSSGISFFSLIDVSRSYLIPSTLVRLLCCKYGRLQIPSPWKSVLEDSSTLQLFFDYYAITKAPLSKEVCTSCICFFDCVLSQTSYSSHENCIPI